MDKDELAGMTVPELLALADRLKAPMKKRMKKAEMVEAIARISSGGPASKPGNAPQASLQVSEAGRARRGIPESVMKQAMEESKFYMGPSPEAPWGMPGDVPHEYGDDRIRLMARDPHWAYSYWEVTQRKLDMERAALGEAGAGAHLALRLYDITDVVFDGRNAHGHFDVGIYERVGSWYLDIGRPGRSFVVDLGLKTRDGRFVMLARSNSISSPRDGVSDILDEEWVLPEADFGRIFALSGGYGIGLSSAEVRLAAAQRIPFGMASPGMGSLALMSPMKKRQRGFWFTLNTELIVYGATEPDARVTVQGVPVNLRPDGTFTLRFALPDGAQDIPVSFTSADEVDTGWITPKISRQTSY